MTIISARLSRALRPLLVVALGLGCSPAAAQPNAAVILHGNGETPDHVAALADGVRREGVAVVTPELPWSSRLSYGRLVADADVQVDKAVADLRVAGARRVFVIGQSLGASYALRYAGRPGVDGVVVIAPGHAPESPLYARTFADDLRRARDFIARGQPNALLEFLDMQWGNRRNRFRAPAAAFLNYFDPAGPLNLARNAEQLRPDALMLWIVPNDDPVAARYAAEAYSRARVNAGSRLMPLPITYQQIPTAASRIIYTWMGETEASIRRD